MTRRTQTRAMRDWFGAKDNRVYDSLPLEKKICSECGHDMLVADGSVQFCHKSCRKLARSKRKIYA